MSFLELVFPGLPFVFSSSAVIYYQLTGEAKVRDYSPFNWRSSFLSLFSSESPISMGTGL